MVQVWIGNMSIETRQIREIRKEVHGSGNNRTEFVVVMGNGNAKNLKRPQMDAFMEQVHEKGIITRMVHDNLMATSDSPVAELGEETSLEGAEDMY